MKMQIGELAKRSGCQVVTIRYYEKEGLLGEPDRTVSNYRLYANEDVERLRFVQHCRQHGIKISEIRDLLAFRNNPESSCDWINELIEKHIANVNEQIDSLRQLKEKLEELQHACSGGKKKRCGIIESLSDAHECSHCEQLSGSSSEDQKSLKRGSRGKARKS